MAWKFAGRIRGRIKVLGDDIMIDCDEQLNFHHSLRRPGHGGFIEGDDVLWKPPKQTVPDH